MTPRDKFRQNRSLSKGYNETIGSDQMQAALDAAMLEHGQSWPPGADVTAAAANNWRKEGAAGFRRILEGLNADSVTVPAPTVAKLDHHV